MRSSSSLPLWPNGCIAANCKKKKARRSGPFRTSLGCLSHLRQRDQDAAGRVVEERSADRALPPACGERGVLVVAQHDEVHAQALGQPADLLDRLADREVSGGVVAAVAQRADALVERRLRALLFLF